MFKKYAPFAGIAGVVTLWLSVLISLVITKFDVLGLRPISYLGVYDRSEYLFNGGLILSSILLLIFLKFLSAHLKLSKAFIAVFSLGQIAQIIVALTPFNSPTIARPVHVVAGFVLALTLPLSMLFFSQSKGLLPALQSVSKKLFIAETVLFVLGIGWFVLASRAGALAEIVTAVTFDIWILAVSVILLRKK